MPELPEVETIVKGLKQNIVGKRVVGIERSKKKFRNNELGVVLDALYGRKIINVTRRAKYILIQFEEISGIEPVLVIHLGMSGRLLFKAKCIPAKHDHLILELDSREFVVFNDPRRFGCILLFENMRALNSNKIFIESGFEPLSEEFTPKLLGKLLAASKMNIKSFLLDGRKIAGIGNIYASEALFDAGIAPLRKATSITDIEVKKLHLAIIEVLESAIKSGGSTLRDYVRSDGDIGGFQHKFKVYGKKGTPCFICSKPLEMSRISGRSTFFCKSCQK